MDFDIYYINLYLNNTSLFEDRLKREGKGVLEYAKFKAESSINQQNTYLKMSEELSSISKNIKVFQVSNDDGEEILKEKIKKIIGD
ncbi:hypothetical protein D3C76_1477320 [compost metagenome]